MGTFASIRLAAVLIAALALSGSLPAQDDEYDNEDGRRSTWEPNTSLTFRRYLEPFARVPSARACRNRCVRERRCAGWTYYDANFRDAGPLSYKLQRICVTGAGLKERKSGNRPGRTSGVVRQAGHNGDDD